MIIYLATPIRPKNGKTVEENVQYAKLLALELWEKGYTVFCPAANSDLPITLAEKEVEADRWLNGDIEILARCDALVVSPGWELSEGVKGEIASAKMYGVPVYYYPELPKLYDLSDMPELDDDDD
jgi:hypothetical protein